MKKNTPEKNQEKNHKKRKNNMKKILISLIAVLGVSAAVAIILANLKQSKEAKKEDYDLVMESLEDVIKEDKTKVRLSKDIALRIIRFQFEKAKLAHRETLTEENVCDLNKKLKEHVAFSCKYSANPEECAERVFGLDTKSLKEALKVFNCD